MEALRIISDEHKNFWRMAVTLEQVANELEAGASVAPAFSNRPSTTSSSLPTARTI